MTPSSTVCISSAPLTVYHRGFSVSLLTMAGGTGTYGFVIRHLDLVLHSSGGAYASVARAETEARRFIDDALGAFDHACAALDVAD
ncbi:MAG: hypothetical protein R3181_03095 [Rubricoccaceae bacterium]|nr:hypothetical protein [Rubricoccaceae bacterium]